LQIQWLDLIISWTMPVCRVSTVNGPSLSHLRMYVNGKCQRLRDGRDTHDPLD